MSEYVDKLDERVRILEEALEKKNQNPDYDFDEVKAVDMLIKFAIYFHEDEENQVDGLYIYINDDGEIVNAEYFVKENDDITIISLNDEQLELIIELFSDVFTVNVE
ncbi:MAG: hypothetical protein BZ137_01785 [Methanosphaera sp. rholeuAM130]|nr:hypothetical protein [Methanosphaera sp.]RAP54518.1 MAG: hypothetical protein BZ137_01785 [Methanosphaera sp. rholeuAM130]